MISKELFSLLIYTTASQLFGLYHSAPGFSGKNSAPCQSWVPQRPSSTGNQNAAWWSGFSKWVCLSSWSLVTSTDLLVVQDDFQINTTDITSVLVNPERKESACTTNRPCAFVYITKHQNRGLHQKIDNELFFIRPIFYLVHNNLLTYNKSK